MPKNTAPMKTPRYDNTVAHIARGKSRTTKSRAARQQSRIAARRSKLERRDDVPALTRELSEETYCPHPRTKFPVLIKYMVDQAIANPNAFAPKVGKVPCRVL